MKQFDPSLYKHIFSDGKTHLLKLNIFEWGQRFVIELDKYIIKRGTFFDDFEPPVNPPEMIDDPNDIKPDSWDDRLEILDPSHIKPNDW